MQAGEDWRRVVDERVSRRSRTISRALGEELRRAREELGLSRAQLVARMPSGIGDRTLLSYEHGTRHLNVLRLVEISRALVVPAPVLLARGLQRARIHVENMPLTVDLRFLLNDRSDKFRPDGPVGAQHPQRTPGRGCGDRAGGGAAPGVVRRLHYLELANYLARFIPEDRLDRQEQTKVLNRQDVSVR